MMLKPTPTPPVPTRLDELLGFSLACPCGITHGVDLEYASIRDGALSDVVDFAQSIRPNSRIVVVTDGTIRNICGDKTRKLLESNGNQTELFVVADGKGGRPHADEQTLLFVDEALAGADLAVAVGSGTINDLTKLSSFKADIPYITVATAPSMNGYTSGIAAIMIQGVKRTVNCHQPRAVVADLSILSKAPKELVASGLGDLESKPTSTADYRLGGILNNTHYCTVPESVVFHAERRAAEEAAGLKTGDLTSIEALTEALILSGVAMKLAGSSSPASGGEHLISHYFDMTAEDEGRLEGWHGAQVGVATIVTATLFEHLRNLSPEKIDVDAIVAARPSRPKIEAAIHRRHGKRAEEVIGEFFQKYRTDDALAETLFRVKSEWDDIWKSLDPILRTGSEVRQILEAGGAPTRIQDLGLTPFHLQKSFVAAREIRSRFTVLDFAADLGKLEALRDPVLHESGCLL